MCVTFAGEGLRTRLDWGHHLSAKHEVKIHKPIKKNGTDNSYAEFHPVFQVSFLQVSKLCAVAEQNTTYDGAICPTVHYATDANTLPSN